MLPTPSHTKRVPPPCGRSTNSSPATHFMTRVVQPSMMRMDNVHLPVIKCCGKPFFKMDVVSARFSMPFSQVCQDGWASPVDGVVTLHHPLLLHGLAFSLCAIRLSPLALPHPLILHRLHPPHLTLPLRF